MTQGDSNPKKTDDYTADDVPAADEEPARVRPKSKLDLNEPEMAPEEEEASEDQEQVEAQPEEVEEVKPSEPASRKRKPRKE